MTENGQHPKGGTGIELEDTDVEIYGDFAIFHFHLTIDVDEEIVLPAGGSVAAQVPIGLPFDELQRILQRMLAAKIEGRFHPGGFPS